MSEYVFGLVRGGELRSKLRGKVSKALESIAQEHGADFVGPVSIPGNEVCGWFTCPNLGEPFDRNTRRAVTDAVKAAGYGWIWGE